MNNLDFSLSTTHIIVKPFIKPFVCRIKLTCALGHLRIITLFRSHSSLKHITTKLVLCKCRLLSHTKQKTNIKQKRGTSNIGLFTVPSVFKIAIYIYRLLWMRSVFAINGTVLISVDTVVNEVWLQPPIIIIRSHSCPKYVLIVPLEYIKYLQTEK